MGKFRKVFKKSVIFLSIFSIAGFTLVNSSNSNSNSQNGSYYNEENFNRNGIPKNALITQYVDASGYQMVGTSVGVYERKDGSTLFKRIDSVSIGEIISMFAYKGRLYSFENGGILVYSCNIGGNWGGNGVTGSNNICKTLGGNSISKMVLSNKNIYFFTNSGDTKIGVANADDFAQSVGSSTYVFKLLNYKLMISHFSHAIDNQSGKIAFDNNYFYIVDNNFSLNAFNLNDLIHAKSGSSISPNIHTVNNFASFIATDGNALYASEISSHLIVKAKESDFTTSFNFSRSISHDISNNITYVSWLGVDKNGIIYACTYNLQKHTSILQTYDFNNDTVNYITLSNGNAFNGNYVKKDGIQPNYVPGKVGFHFFLETSNDKTVLLSFINLSTGQLFDYQVSGTMDSHLGPFVYKLKNASKMPPASKNHFGTEITLIVVGAAVVLLIFYLLIRKVIKRKKQVSKLQK